MHFLFKNEIVDYDFINNKKNKTILFLHGWGGNKNSFSQTINLTKKNFNVLSLTLPTTKPTTSVWDLFDYVELVNQILKNHSIDSVIIVCHSFGLRIAMLLNKKIKIEKIIITGGAGLKKSNIFTKTALNNNKILLKCEKFKFLFKKIASEDYQNLSVINRQTFKNIINLNLCFATKFNCEMLLFWGKNDRSTKLWMAKKLKKSNQAKLILTNSDHFAYLKENSLFNHAVLNFLNKI